MDRLGPFFYALRADNNSFTSNSCTWQASSNDSICAHGQYMQCKPKLVSISSALG